MFYQDSKSETISETSTIKDEGGTDDRDNEDHEDDRDIDDHEDHEDEEDVVHVECLVKAEETTGGILEAAVQDHQMTSMQDNHQITILKLRVLGKQ